MNCQKLELINRLTLAMTDGVNNVELLKRSKYELDSFLTITSDNHKRTDELVAFHFLQGPRNCISASLSHEAIDEAQIASSMFLNSQFKMAEEQMASWYVRGEEGGKPYLKNCDTYFCSSDRSMYHATFMFIKAIMSYEKVADSYFIVLTLLNNIVLRET